MAFKLGNMKTMNWNIGMTKEALEKAFSKHRFVALRWDDGVVTGVNSAAARIGMRKRDPDDRSRIVSYNPISFQEYISTKIKFV